MLRTGPIKGSYPSVRDETARSVRTNLTRTWLRFRMPTAIVTSSVALLLAGLWQWPPGLLVAGLGAVAVIDAWRRRKSIEPSAMFPLIIDTTLTLVAMAVVQLPDAAMGLPYAYTVVAAVLLLPLRRALPVLVYGAVLFLLVQRSMISFPTVLSDTQVLTIGVIADLIFFVLLVALVIVASRELIAETARAEMAVTYEQAVAACSRALLRGTDDEPLAEALQALLGPSEADTAFVERNEVHPEVGLCSRLIREVDRAGPVQPEMEVAQGVPWTRMQTAHDALSAGEPFDFLVDDLPGTERALYAGSGIQTELDVPIRVDGAWLGVVGFTRRSPGHWPHKERRILAAAAELIGSHWSRRDVRSRLETSVNQLEQRTSYQSALASSAEALLGSQVEGDVGKALEALMEATDADYVYVDENYQDPRLGLCARITDFYERPGAEASAAEEWMHGPYSELPTAFASLSRGEPVHIVTSLLEGPELEVYVRDGIRAELCVPIMVDDRWTGSISFCDYHEERQWTAHELATLQNAARMLGSYIERRNATLKLERAVAALDVKLAHEAALSRCSEALLRGSGEAALQTALESLVEATGAHKIFIDENFTDSSRGLCARVTHEAIRPGFEEIVDAEIFFDEESGEIIHTVVEYGQIPTVYQTLRKGVPAIVDVAQLSGGERDLYEEDGCSGEVNIPVFVGEEWVGCVGLALYREPPEWTDDELRMLTTAAGMVGAFWERNAAHSRLEELVSSKDELIASVSHELRTPLTATLGLAEILATAELARLDPESAEFLDMIKANSQEMAHIVDDLLAAALSDINTLVVAPEVVDVADVVSSVAHDRLPALGSSVPEVMVRGSALKAWADPSRVRQIVRNLLVNAGKYGGNRVWVVVGSSAKGVSVAVCDNGPGVRPESEQAIFDAFSRAHELPTQPASLGLGLAISRRLARLMGGELEYRRKPEQTEFVLTLPEPVA